MAEMRRDSRRIFPVFSRANEPPSDRRTRLGCSGGPGRRGRLRCRSALIFPHRQLPGLQHGLVFDSPRSMCAARAADHAGQLELYQAGAWVAIAEHRALLPHCRRLLKITAAKLSPQPSQPVEEAPPAIFYPVVTHDSSPWSRLAACTNLLDRSVRYRTVCGEYCRDRADREFAACRGLRRGLEIAVQLPGESFNPLRSSCCMRALAYGHRIR